MIDFRHGGADPAVTMLPIPELAKGRWSAPKPQGVWAKGASADFQLEFPTGGHQMLIVECRPASGNNPVRILRIAINGIDCGAVELAPDWKRYRLALPADAVRPGPNRVVFRFPDRDEAEKPWRAILVRKLGWFFDDTVGVEALDDVSPVSLDLEAERITIRRSGTVEIPVVLDDRTDALHMRYRFLSGVGRADVVVEQSVDGGAGLDKAMKATMSAEEKRSGRVRIPLHGRRGRFVIRIRAELEPSGSQLLISPLRLVEEGDPTRRPWAANPPPS